MRAVRLQAIEGLVICAALLGMAGAAAGQSRFMEGGAQVFAGSEPGALVIVGTLTPDTPNRILQALQDNPTTTTIELLSSGGSILPALSIAWEIHERGLRTRIPEGSLCYSACAYMFLAGAGRDVDGQLGVHQFWAENGGERTEMSAAHDQWNTDRIREAMEAFGVDPHVQAAMFTTPPEQMHVFTDNELETYGVERTAAAPPVAQFQEWADAGVTRIPKNMLSETDKRYQTIESAVAIDETQGNTLIDVMVRSGINTEYAVAIAQVLTETDPNIGDDFMGSDMRILWGPLLSLPTHIPYRVSLYRPGPDGANQHIATAALSDTGQYVVGIDPDHPSDPVAVLATGKGPRVE